MFLDITKFKSIEVDPLRAGGKPVLKGTRFTIAQILSQIRDGDSIDDLASNLNLDKENIKLFFRELDIVFSQMFYDLK